MVWTISGSLCNTRTKSRRSKSSAAWQPSSKITGKGSSMRRRLTLIGLCVALVAISGSRAASAIDGFKVETLANDLVEPTALALQPGTETIFVSESGTGKILAFPKDKPDARYVAIEGFPKLEKTKDLDPA